MSKPLAIDLFCGLLEPELRWGADALVEKLVACRAQNPDHMPLAVRHKSPSAVALKAGPVSDFDNSRFATRFAHNRYIRIAAPQALKSNVSIRASRVIFALRVGFCFVERLTLRLSCFCCADFRAIALIAVRRRNIEMRTAYAAVASFLCYVILLAAPQPTSAALAFDRTIKLIGTLGFKIAAAIIAGKIVHHRKLA